MPAFLRTLRSLRRTSDAPYWQIDCHGDYRLRDFLRVGARGDRELLEAVRAEFMPLLPRAALPPLPDFGCSTFVVRTPDGRALFGRNFDLDKRGRMTTPSRAAGSPRASRPS